MKLLVPLVPPELLTLTFVVPSAVAFGAGTVIVLASTTVKPPAVICTPPTVTRFAPLKLLPVSVSVPPSKACTDDGETEPSTGGLTEPPGSKPPIASTPVPDGSSQAFTEFQARSKRP